MAHPAHRSAPSLRQPTLSEFLRVEAASDHRLEFHEGRVYAMTGASLRHNRIVGNLRVELMALAGAGPCQVYAEAVKLRTQGCVFYPDVMVVCGPHDQTAHHVTAPCLVVEVLSPSTDGDDRYGRKLRLYRRTPSVRSYLVVEQTRRAVTRHWRDAADAPWRVETIVGTGEVPVPCPVAGTLALDAIYRGTTPDDGDDAAAPPLRRVREGAAR